LTGTIVVPHGRDSRGLLLQLILVLAVLRIVEVTIDFSCHLGVINLLHIVLVNQYKEAHGAPISSILFSLKHSSSSLKTMKSSIPLAALAATFADVAYAAPNGPWPTRSSWGVAPWQHGSFPSSWPVPSWAKPCYSTTTIASVSPSGSAGASATAPTTVTATPSAPAGASGTPSATVKNGTLTGVHNAAYNQDFFLGVPYAQPPINNLRFRPAQSINSSYAGGLYEATRISPECVGYGSDQWNYPVSEDCLYLNVIRPANYSAYDDPLPVAFWIHASLIIVLL
jgi:hypothetical protein